MKRLLLQLLALFKKKEEVFTADSKLDMTGNCWDGFGYALNARNEKIQKMKAERTIRSFRKWNS